VPWPNLNIYKLILIYDTSLNIWKERAHTYQTQKPLKWIQLKYHTARFQESVQYSLKYVADTDKHITATINEDEAFDETDCVRGVIQIKTEVWNIKSKLDLGKKWGDDFGFSVGKSENISCKNVLLLSELIWPIQEQMQSLGDAFLPLMHYEPMKRINSD